LANFGHHFLNLKSLGPLTKFYHGEINDKKEYFRRCWMDFSCEWHMVNPISINFLSSYVYACHLCWMLETSLIDKCSHKNTTHVPAKLFLTAQSIFLHFTGPSKQVCSQRVASETVRGRGEMFSASPAVKDRKRYRISNLAVLSMNKSKSTKLWIKGFVNCSMGTKQKNKIKIREKLWLGQISAFSALFSTYQKNPSTKSKLKNKEYVCQVSSKSLKNCDL